MGCKQSKHAALVDTGGDNGARRVKSRGIASTPSTVGSRSDPTTPDDATPETYLDGLDSPPGIRRVWEQGSQLYKLLDSEIKKTTVNGGSATVRHDAELWYKVIQICDTAPDAAEYFHPKKLSTPLHLACKLIDDSGVSPMSKIDRPETAGGPTALDAMRALITACPDAVSRLDVNGHIPLHYAISQPLKKSQINSVPGYKLRMDAIKLLATSDFETSVDYLSKNDIVYDETSGGRTALYHAIDSLQDDVTHVGASYEFVQTIHELSPAMVGVRNASDGDTSLALLYRRFVRQFDSSEKFFPGDNSRREVVEHREEYKVAAMNTFRIIDLLLRPTEDDEHEEINSEQQSRLVHNASMIDCPPDLFRYIVETHVDQVREKEEKTGKLPLHIAAAACSTRQLAGIDTSYPAYHSKFVIDELLYAYRNGAAVQDKDGNYPFVLAINAGKKWIDGGLKSLYEAFPDATHQIDTENIHASIKQALSFTSAGSYGDSIDGASACNSVGIPVVSSAKIKRDNHHDAIMLVQKDGASIWDIVSAMWANEEDGGVQMLGCMAIEKLALDAKDDASLIHVALSAVTAIVNAMKNHPNEPIVQERSCSALLAISAADGKREISFAASGAVASIVSAMQAHVSDAAVQENACCALRKVVEQGGAERATVVASVSGFTAIVNAMGAHPDEEGVQREACQTLEVMTGFPDANLPDLPGMQTASLLNEAKEQFPENCADAVDVILTRLS